MLAILWCVPFVAIIANPLGFSEQVRLGIAVLLLLTTISCASQLAIRMKSRMQLLVLGNGLILCGVLPLLALPAATFSEVARFGVPEAAILVGQIIQSRWQLFAVFGLIITGGVGCLSLAQKRDWFRVTTDSAGSSAFASVKEMAARSLYEPVGPIIGEQSGRLLHLPEFEAHALSFGSSRIGKGVSTIIPNAARWPNSVVIVEPKGETAFLTSMRSALRSQVIVDPFGVAGKTEFSAGFNPLAGVRRAHAYGDLKLIADALTDGGDGIGGSAENHFREIASTALVAILGYMAFDVGSADWRQIRELGTGRLKTTAKLMRESQALSGRVATAGDMLSGLGDGELGSVTSTLDRALAFLYNDAVCDTLSRNDVKWKEVFAGRQDVYFYLPEGQYQQLGGFLRLFVGSMVDQVSRQKGLQTARTLAFVDEAWALGRFQQLERAYAIAAGYGLSVWSIWQSWTQIKALYRDKAEAFLDSADITELLGARGKDSTKYWSEMAGIATIAREQQSKSKGVSGSSLDAKTSSNTSSSLQESGRPLVTLDEIRRLHQDDKIVFVRNMQPLKLRKPYFFRMKQLADVAEAQEAWGKIVSREMV